jgi:hypothetical protein
VLQWHRQFEPVFCFKTMPNPWTGKGNPYTRKEVRERLMDTIKKGDAVIAAGAGAGISAKFIEKGGADLIIIYNSGRFRMNLPPALARASAPNSSRRAAPISSSSTTPAASA